MDSHLIRVTALKSFDHEGRSLEPGEVFAVRPIIAAALRYQGRIALDSDVGSAVRLKDPPKRRYRRRDLKAED